MKTHLLKLNIFLLISAALPPLNLKAAASAAFLRALKTTLRPPANPPPPQPEPPPEEPAAEGGPKQVKFTQATQGKAIELKQVEGSNDGGVTTTPDKDLSAWYSEQLYDIPTQTSWANDDAYNQQQAPQETVAQEAEKPKVVAPTSLSPQKGSGSSAGAFIGGGASGSAKAQNAENDARSLRQSLIQTGHNRANFAAQGGVRRTPKLPPRTQQQISTRLRAGREIFIKRRTMSTQATPREEPATPRAIIPVHEDVAAIDADNVRATTPT